ncbi:MAG: OmpH family outer membrane protein [Phycisphaerales bacterium]|nr:OmpH family outer membrane protein [Phycisphaerales bacterium]
MKHKLTIVGLVVLGVAVLVGSSQGNSQMSNQTMRSGSGACCVGVIDFVRIFNECAEIQDLNQRIRQEEAAIQAEVKKRKEKIAEKQIALSAFQPGTADYEQRRRELMRMNIEANVWFEMAQQDLEKQKFDWTRIIYEKSAKLAGNIAKERGYDILLQFKEFKPEVIEQTVAGIRRMIQDRAVIYAVPELDITDMVIRRLNEQYRTSGGNRRTPATPSGTMTPTP